MKALLLYRDRDFDSHQSLVQHEPALSQDLELDTLLRAMAGDDKFLFDVARSVLLAPPGNDLGVVLYRQEIVEDCLKNPVVVRRLYELAVEANTSKETKRFFGVFARYPAGILSDAIGVLEALSGMLQTLRSIADEYSLRFTSRGFTNLFAMLNAELTDEYLAQVEKHLTELRFRQGILMSAKLGEGNEGTSYVLHRTPPRKRKWFEWLLGRREAVFTIRIPERDQAGATALSELRDRGINLVANAAAQSADHVLSFFEMLRTELAFYVACLNLHAQVERLGAPIAFPKPDPAGTGTLRFAGLYDICLALRMERKVVGNDLHADRKRLVIITGANQGGKSTFLRSVGLAQLMMQSGMFVAAESFAADLCSGVFTHYKREEDATLKSGKLDEELSRMSDIASALSPNAMVLFNESFSATNEREGSEIGRQVVCALMERGIRVVFVTHLHQLARDLLDRAMDDVVFLRAERLADSTRTFRILEGEPLETSFGQDVYREVFANGPDRVSPGISEQEAKRGLHLGATQLGADKGNGSSIAQKWTICPSGHVHWGAHGAAGLLLRYVPPKGDPTYLLQQRSRQVDEGGTWGIPGGALREGESPEAGAHREAEAQIGSLPSYRITGIEEQDCGGGWKFFIVKADVSSPFPAYCVQDTDALGWFALADMQSLPLHSRLSS